ncbi:MAG: [FeFe] hydrogenase H-cluster maturation GTPase HydF [Clostridium sp.]|nr:[FeFe] hydrogenase H-cluster maturation GTPase HydF [Clostridium sp.]MCM1547142.1 [FeFe] hydrogenase H-cluster maturation GTPase HydF [Ruminococcus sp.]
MISEIDQTPKSLRIHIGVFGDTNAGKSTFINTVTGHDIALTSPVAGTTTDPVFKPMELLPLGPVVFIDTAGLDDESELGEIRIKKSVEQLVQCDAAVLVVNGKSTADSQLRYIDMLKKKNIPFMAVINSVGDTKCEIDMNDVCSNIIIADLSDRGEADKIKAALIDLLKDRIEEPVLTADLVKPGDLVMLTAPQDIQAPKGRLILPEVQVTRDLLDNGCMVLTVTSQNIKSALNSLKELPALVITDSQIFKEVNEIIPKEIPLTSFSLLMAKIKGDIKELVNGARAIESLDDGDSVLILESCAHHALDDDIARVKIPNLLKKYTGKKLNIENVSGQNVGLDLKKYKLAVHCGGCMVNRKAMLSKQKMFEDVGVPMTNFGVCIAYVNKMLERVCY